MPASATASRSAPGSATHIARKRVLDRDDMVAIARRGAADSLAAGITTTADYSFSGAAADAASELGLRAIVYLEVFGSDPAAAAERFEELRAASRRPSSSGSASRRTPRTPARSRSTATASRSASRSARTSPRATARTSGSSTAPARSRPRRDVLVAPTGKRAVATLAEVLGPELLCAHCVALDEGEIARARGGGRPGRALPALERAARLRRRAARGAPARAGVRVGLGTDSPASTPSFDPWDEMRAAVSAARARERRPDALERRRRAAARDARLGGRARARRASSAASLRASAPT